MFQNITNTPEGEPLNKRYNEEILPLIEAETKKYIEAIKNIAGVDSQKTPVFVLGMMVPLGMSNDGVHGYSATYNVSNAGEIMKMKILSDLVHES